MSATAAPRTAVLIQFAGMGDLVWHVPYFRRVAEASADGQVSVIAPPSTFARELIGHEPWLREVIDFDRRPRRSERRQGRHSGLGGLLRMGAELAPKRFDRLVLFTLHPGRAIVAAWRAGIGQRIGFGTTWLQRRLLTNRGLWIDRYRGPAVAAHKDATAFCIAQGWCDGAIVPRLTVRPDALDHMQHRLAALPRPLHALAIGSSEPFKQWGEVRFAALAELLAGHGHGVLLVGGPAERELAQAIVQRIAPARRPDVMTLTDASVADTVAAMSLARTCIGNDTGATNIAAAVATPTFVLLGPRPDLEHDPATMRLLKAPRLDDLTPAEVAQHALAAA